MSEGSRKNVCNTIVANNLCIGCGLCAAICPNNHLKIEFNEFGEYTATEKDNECPDTCSMCLAVCPFFESDENEDTLAGKLFADTPEIKHTPQTGYYLKAFVGYSNVNGHRSNGASGGMVTWLLETLLEKGMVDYVACVSPAKDTDKLFKFRICTTAEEIRASSRSSYYPVEASEVIEHILSHEGRYAITALPCHCKAIRLAAQLNSKLRRRVRFLLGLACGQTKSKFFAEYICALGAGAADRLGSFTFRVKSPNRPASDFGMKFGCEAKGNPPQEGVVFWSEGISRAWHDRYFTPNACNFCDDVFAELADVCFTDAWLPEYSTDWQGHSIILLREGTLSSLVEQASEDNSISIKPLDITRVIKSQKGALSSKRFDLSERVRFARKSGQIVPLKRLGLCKTKSAFSTKWLVRARFLVSQKSGRAWMEAKKQLPDFLEKLKPEIVRLRRASLYEKLGCLPAKMVRRLRNAIV